MDLETKVFTQTETSRPPNRPSLMDAYDLDATAARRARRRASIRSGEYARLLEKQGGCCAICHATEGAADGRQLSVDHDHTTNATRGLLCGSCNLGLGKFKDSIPLLLAACDYLSAAKETTCPTTKPLSLTSRLMAFWTKLRNFTPYNSGQ